MRGLRKYLTPFAPDQSGAVSVLYEMGGILVVCDAGGCTGNICGFDEPRWFERKSALFSAGLRDMDAIFGRDDRMVDKLADAAAKLNAGFAAIIGTPVPAVIGTDYRAIERMCRKKTELPVFGIDTDGMQLYDVGEEKAYLALFKTFAAEPENLDAAEFEASKTGRIGILGMTPQDVSDMKAAEKMRKYFREKYNKEAICYGMGAGLDEVKKACASEKNIVVSPAALAVAKYLDEKFGTHYEVAYPIVGERIPPMDYEDKNVLVVHQQVMGNAVREELSRRGCKAVTVASWFMMKRELSESADVSLKEEDDYIELVKTGNYDVIFADKCMARMTPEFKGEFVNLPHFAVSGKLCD